MDLSTQPKEKQDVDTPKENQSAKRKSRQNRKMKEVEEVSDCTENTDLEDDSEELGEDEKCIQGKEALEKLTAEQESEGRCKYAQMGRRIDGTKARQVWNNKVRL